MSKIPRKKVIIYGNNALTEDISQFGSAAANGGVPIDTIDPEIIQALNAWDTGWRNAVVQDQSGNPYAPRFDDFNALQYYNTYHLAYLMQQGIPEWDTNTTYYLYSLCLYSDGNLYQSLINNNIGNIPTNQSYWKKLIFRDTAQNIIINGDMLVSQSENGVLGYFKNGIYTYPADRWACWSTVTSGTLPTGTIERVTQQWSFSKRGYGINFRTYQTSNTTLQHHQRYRMESNDSRNLCNANIINDFFSISALIKHNWSTAKNLTLNLRTPSFQNNFSTMSLIYTSTIAIASGLTNGVIAKFEGITTNSPTIRNGLEIEFVFDAGVSGTINNFFISEVQAENNSICTNFEYKNYSTELLACQRYFNVITRISGQVGLALLPNIDYNRASLSYNFPTEMIKSPSISYTNTSTAWPVQLIETTNATLITRLINSIINTYVNTSSLTLDVELNNTSGNCRPLLQTQGFIYVNSEL
jgi:hypothetical protein